MSELTGKVAIVTGASKGIGAAIAKRRFDLAVRFAAHHQMAAARIHRGVVPETYTR